MMRLRLVLSALVLFPVLAGAGLLHARDARSALKASPTEAPAAVLEDGETLSGGAATSIDPPDRNAFSHMSGNLLPSDEMRFHLGRALFRKLWVAAPSSTQASDGLGPLYNARSCESCHQRDGRGAPPEAGLPSLSLLLRLARPPEDAQEQALLDKRQVWNFPDAVYGTQLQDHGIPGLAGEGQVAADYEEQPVRLGDGSVVSLRKPVFRITGPAGDRLGRTTTLSPRLTPPMIGLGLIEAIDAADIRALADPDDRDGDGISGRTAWAPASAGAEPRLGRFGWKAQNATVAEQTATALALDMGISSPLADLPYGDCTKRQADCLERATGVQPRLGKTEAPGPVLDLITFYAENIAVPARRRASFPDVLAGKGVFHSLGCPACHVPSHITGRDAAIKALGGQRIWPYSDFLLHDMGAGLSDGQSVGGASGTEWRTPPLWGLGLAATVNGHGFYLHDGRARNLTEAILWHGGEATKARNAFMSASARDRQSLLTFLESL